VRSLRIQPPDGSSGRRSDPSARTASTGEDDAGAAPLVAAVVAVLNEARHLPQLLTRLLAQDYPAERLEVIVADGGSADGSPEIVADFAAAASDASAQGAPAVRIRTIQNPHRVPAGGFNRAIEITDSDIIVLIGGHMSLPEDYVSSVVRALLDSGAACAGGRIDTKGVSPQGQANAVALSSRIGVGGARFRTATAEPQFVDTVAFGAYWRADLQEVGGFDLDLVGAEDDEMSLRLLRAGKRIWLDPSIVTTYYCREDLRGLFRQYRSYGQGKARVVRKHRRAPSLRALVPPTFVVCLGASLIASPLNAVPVLLVAGPYIAAVGAASVRMAKTRAVSPIRVAAAVATMHVSYGVGFLGGIVTRRTAP
jgi:succinoglycan biosynthesis protein ExoA